MSYFRRLSRRGRQSLAILAVTALGLAAIAAFIAMVKISLDLRLGDTGNRGGSGVAVEDDRKPPSPPAFSASDYRQSRSPRPVRQPLIGANYTHYAFPNCSLKDTGILRSYSKPGIAQKVHAQLLQMRKAGVASIRTILFHQNNETGQAWGPIPSPRGMLRDPYRTNLIRYVTEIRKFGFARLTIAFGPTETGNPRLPIYEPAELGQNWRFIRAVRSLVKRHGPRDTRIDLMSEGAPSERPSAYFPVPRQTSRYLGTLYRLYVKRFGSRDVVISVIAPTYPGDRTNRLQTLIHIIRSTRQPLPRWYEVHIPYDRVSASFALRNVDMVLNANGQNQPLVIGETAYDNPRIAKTIRSFLQSSSRRIDEVLPWFLRTREGCWVPPPYEPGAYARVSNAR